MYTCRAGSSGSLASWPGTSLETSMISFVSGAANCDEELAKRTPGNLERLLWKAKLTDGVYSFALVLPSE